MNDAASLVRPPNYRKPEKKKDIKGLKPWLTRTYPSEECESVAEALAELGYQQENDEAGAVLALLDRDFARAVSIGTPAVAPLVALLRDEKTYERSFGVVRHASEDGELGGESYEMVDPIRKEALEALTSIGSDAIPGLAQILACEGKALGRAFEPILSILVESDDPRAMDGFLQALKQLPHSYIFWEKLHTAICKHKDRRFVAPLRRILTEHSLREREQEIRRILTELGEKVAPW